MNDEKTQINKHATYLAEKFHRYYEEFATRFGYETREETKKFDRNSANGKLMIAVCDKILQDLIV